MRNLYLKLIMVLVVFIISDLSFAASKYWDNGGADNLWSTPENWLSDTAPVNGDIIYFGNYAPDVPQTVILDTDFTVSYLRCRATGSREYTIDTANGSAITNFTSTSLNIYCDATFATKFTVNVDLYDNKVFQVDRTSTNGLVVINGSVVINGPDSGTSWLNADGPGELEFGGSNSFSYVRNYDAGEIVLNHPYALTGSFFKNYVNCILSVAKDAIIPGTFEIDTSMMVRLKDSGTNDVTLTLQDRCLGDTAIVAPNAGTATGNFFIRITKNSSHIAEWNLATTNSTLILDSTLGTITWGDNSDASVASISGSGTLMVEGTNLVSFYPTNSYTGGTIIRDGKLRIQANDLLPTNGDVVVESDGILDTQSYSQTVKGLSGNGTVIMGAGVTTLSTNTITGILAPGLGGAGTLTFSEPGILLLGAFSTSLFELNGLIDANDQVVMSYPTAAYTGLELAGTLEVENIGGMEEGNYTLFDLNGGPISGSFSATNMPSGFLGVVNITSGDVVLEVTLAPQGTVISIK